MILQHKSSGYPHITVGSTMFEHGYIISDKFELQYRLEGNGTPTIVVGSSLYYARTFSTELRSYLKLAFKDHRGFAPSNPCQDIRKYELDLLVDDIELARKELGFEKFILIGHSGHAFMALEYAKKYPDNVSHLVLIGAAPNFSIAGMVAAERALEESVCPERKAALAANLAKLPRWMMADRDRAFITYCILMGPKSWFDYTFDSTPLWEGIEGNMAMFDYVWGKVFRDIDITQNLNRLRAPVFLALGRYDYLAPPAYLWERVRHKFKDLTVRVFERSGHAPHFEEPDLFNQALLAWLAKKQ